MKKLLAFIFVSASVAQIRAELVFYDSFNYSPVGAQVSSAGAPTWSLRNAGAVDPTIAAGSLSYPGLQTASGDNSVQFNGTGAAGIATHGLGQIYNINNVSTLYYSLTFQVSSISTADWGGGSGNYLNGSFMMGFSQDTAGTLANTSVAAPLLIRTGDPNNTSGMANDFQGFQLGTGVTAVSPGARVFDGTRIYSPGETLFLVLSYSFGANASDDVARLYVNPIPGSLEADNNPVVMASGVADVNNSQIQSIFLRNNSVEPASTLIDDLRVGSTWADVTPVPEPSTLAFIGLGALGLLFVYRFRRA